MKKIIGVVFLLTNIIIFSACFSLSFCQEQVGIVQPQLLKGNVVNVDFIGSKITVRYLQPSGGNAEITLGVTSHTTVGRGDLRISLTDVHKGDDVAVQYYVDPMAFDAPKAIQISVKP